MCFLIGFLQINENLITVREVGRTWLLVPQLLAARFANPSLMLIKLALNPSNEKLIWRENFDPRKTACLSGFGLKAQQKEL